MPTVSVVIPTYNRADYILEAIESVMSQTYRDFEIVVVDDGSTDDTAAIIRAEFSDKVIYHYQPNRGVSHARNTGINIAKGNWIAFLDSDDEWLPEKLQVQLKTLQKHPDHQFCHTNEIWIRNGVRVNSMVKHNKSGGYIFDKCLALCVISPSSVLMRKSIFQQIGMFDENLPACEDYDYWLRYCSRYPVLYVDTPQLVKYGGHQDQLSRKYWGMDQYRLRALLKTLATQKLSEQHQSAVADMIINKCMILEKGAKKHSNLPMLEYCQNVRLQLDAIINYSDAIYLSS